MRANILAIINDCIHKSAEIVIILFSLCMVIIVACNVFARYILKVGIVWAEELSTTMFVWVVFLGAYYALSKKAHLALNFVIKRLPRKLRIFDKWLVIVLVSGLLVALSVGGISFVSNTIRLKQKTPLLGISAAWRYSCIPVSSILMLVEMLTIAFKREAVVELKDLGLEEEDC